MIRLVELVQPGLMRAKATALYRWIHSNALAVKNEMALRYFGEHLGFRTKHLCFRQLIKHTKL